MSTPIRKFNLFSKIIVVLSFVNLQSEALFASIMRLTPQEAVQRALGQGYAAKSADLQAQKLSLVVEQALGIFDFQAAFTPSYSYDAAQNIMGTNNLVDRTAQANLSLSKTFRTGTTLSFAYQSLTQNSTLSSYTNALRTSSVSLDVATLEARQTLLRNSFGLADRLTIEAAEISKTQAKENRTEQLENVALQTMTSFWNAYVAQRQMQDSVDARKRYEALVASTSRRSAFGLTSPGEQPRLQAEFEQASGRVKVAASTYLAAIDSLFTLMSVQSNDDVVFDVSDEIPPVPRLAPKDLASLRPIRIAHGQADASELARRAVYNRSLAQLDMIIRAASTGVEPSADRSRSEMFSGDKPTYYAGLEFRSALDSSLYRAQKASARLTAEIDRNQELLLVDQLRDQMRAAEREVNARHEYAQSATKAGHNRESVVRQVESAYRQGRQPLVEVIRAYNELFGTRSEVAQSIGNYNIALNQLAAVRDELFSTAPTSP